MAKYNPELQSRSEYKKGVVKDIVINAVLYLQLKMFDLSDWYDSHFKEVEPVLIGWDKENPNHYYYGFLPTLMYMTDDFLTWLYELFFPGSNIELMDAVNLAYGDEISDLENYSERQKRVIHQLYHTEAPNA